MEGTIRTDEETRSLLVRILENQAYRQLMLANIRGHGIKFVPELEDKIELASDLEASLRRVREVRRLYERLGAGDVFTTVRARMERIPWPASRMELAVCLFLCERVERIALASYRDSSCRDLAALALSRLAEPDGGAPRDPAFAEFSSEPENRPHAQQLFNRWLTIAVLSLGRPGTRGDARAVALGLRSRHVAEIVREFLEGLAPFLAACGLSMPDGATLGIELPPPAGALPRRDARG